MRNWIAARFLQLETEYLRMSAIEAKQNCAWESSDAVKNAAGAKISGVHTWQPWMTLQK